MRTRHALVLCSLLAVPLPAFGQRDLFILGNANASSPGTASLPVYILDLPPGNGVFGFSVSFVPSRPGLVTAFRRGGVLADAQPDYERGVSRADGGSGYFAWGVYNSPIRTPTGYGDPIGSLDVTIPPGIPKGTRIELALDRSRCMLSGWDPRYSVGGQQLDLRNGAIVIGAFWGDANADGAIDVFDVVTLANAIAGNLQPGQPPFLATLDAMNLNPTVDGGLNVFDLVLLAGYLVGNVPSIPVP